MATRLFLLFALFFMLTICLLFFSSLKEVTCRTKNCCVLHKKLCCVYVRHLNYVWFIKNTMWLQKIIWHSKDWLNMFSVAQKRNTCWQKIVVPVVYKCILSVHWLGEFCIARKMFFDVVQKLKLVCINAIIFCLNGAPYTKEVFFFSFYCILINV